MPESLSYRTVLQSLEELNAPAELIREFVERFEVYGEKPENVEYTLIELCARHRWARIFESDGSPRTFRANLLAPDDPEFRRDSGSQTLGEEQSYRRGYDQGFGAALAVFKSHGVKRAEELSSMVREWRVRRVQRMGSPPGSPEPIAYDIRKPHTDRN